MSHKTILALVFSFISLFSPDLVNHAQAQDTSSNKFTLSAGLGLPQLSFVGAKYSLEQGQLGVDLGGIFGDGSRVVTVTGSYQRGFAGFSKHTSIKPWHYIAGVNYWQEVTNDVSLTSVLLLAQIGRDFNFSPRFGMFTNFGAVVVLYDEGSWSFFGYDLAFPALSVGFFYRLGVNKGQQNN